MTKTRASDYHDYPVVDTDLVSHITSDESGPPKLHNAADFANQMGARLAEWTITDNVLRSMTSTDRDRCVVEWTEDGYW